MRNLKAPILVALGTVVALAVVVGAGVAQGRVSSVTRGSAPRSLAIVGQALADDEQTLRCPVSAEDPVEGVIAALVSGRPVVRRARVVQQFPTGNTCFSVGLIASGDPYKAAVIKASTSSKLDLGAPTIDPTKVGLGDGPDTFKVTVKNLTNNNSSFKSAIVTLSADNRVVAGATVGAAYNGQGELELTVGGLSEERVKVGVIVNLQVEQK